MPAATPSPHRAWCHPDRRHHSGGLCRICYDLRRMEQRRAQALARRPCDRAVPRGEAWLPPEDELLAKQYPAQGKLGVARLLPWRTPDACQARAAMLGIKRDRLAIAVPAEIPASLGARLLNWRALRQRTQREVALCCGLSRDAYRRIETDGDCDPLASTLVRLSAGTGLSLDYLLKGE